MLDEKKIEYRYREYTAEPLSAAELTALLAKLRVSAKEVLRKNDAAYVELGGDESEAALIRKLAAHPTLLARPIGVLGDRAVIGRPPERLLELL